MMVHVVVKISVARLLTILGWDNGSTRMMPDRLEEGGIA